MLRKLKKHIVYKKDGVEIRPASLHEEYEVGNWYSYYDAKIGYEDDDYDSKYSDIIYVMKFDKCIIGYFMAYSNINTGNNKNIPLSNKELVS